MTIEELKLTALGVYATLFIVFTLLVGSALRSRGWMFLHSTFEHRPDVANSVQFLLSLGFYLTCASLLLWNLGEDPRGDWVDGKDVYTIKNLVQTVSTRLGVSILVVAIFHTLNILALSILNQRSRSGVPG